jgi:hypothetical protein
MFESEQLSSSERQALAFLVILIIALSLGYFFWVLFSELWVAFYPTVPLFCIKPKKVEEELNTDIEFADISYERENPINDGEKSTEIVRLQTQLETAESMISQMQSEINSLKKSRKSETVASSAPIAPRKTKKKTLQSDADDDAHIQLM